MGAQGWSGVGKAEGSAGAGWPTRELAEFLAAAASFATEASAAAGIVERVARTLDADVVAVVARGAPVAAVGYPDGVAPIAELAAVARGDRAELVVPGAGRCAAVVVPLEHPPAACLVVARAHPGPLTADEVGLLRDMARVAAMTLRVLRLADDERELRERSRRQGAENARLLAALSEHEARLELLAHERAALRRVATLDALRPDAAEVLAGVAEEIGGLLGAGLTQLLTVEPDGTATVVAGWADPAGTARRIPVGTRLVVADDGLAGRVVRSRRATRMSGGTPSDGGPVADHVRDCGLRSATASPIEVEGRLWGVLLVCWAAPAPPEGAESRIAAFTHLSATSIANVEARAEVGRMTDQQNALHRVASLVAVEGGPPGAALTSAAAEIAGLPGVDNGLVLRFEADGAATVVAHSGRAEIGMPVGSSWPPDAGGVTAQLFGTGSRAHPSGSGGDFACVGAPIVIGGRLWGAATAAWTLRDDGQPGARAVAVRERLAEFADLLALAVCTADARAKLTASRTRVVRAADEARRRLERNLHDGVQQGLVSLELTLREAEAMAPSEPAVLPQTIARVADGMSGVLDDIREIARGLHPAVLSAGGLRSALAALARRSAVPATVAVRLDGRLPERVEVTAYYVVAEALTNAAKHARASEVGIEVEATDGAVRVAVRDDGVGGADPAGGSGLIGLVDRVEAAGGVITITSPPGAGTALVVTLPLVDR